MDFEQCDFCKKKDFSENLISPCKCQILCHPKCLNRRRIANPANFNRCPICGAEYNMEERLLPKWKKYFQIVISVIIDLFGFAATFLAASVVIGWVLDIIGYHTSISEKPVVIGMIAMTIILGIITIIYGLMHMDPQMQFYLSGRGFGGGNDGSAIIVLLVVGIIVIILSSLYFIFTTMKRRLELHERAVAVQEHIVHNYGKGVA